MTARGNNGGHVLGQRTIRILELAARHDGVTSREAADFTGCCPKVAGSMCSVMANTGKIFAGKVPRIALHYFRDAAAATAWEGRQTAPTWKLDLQGTPKDLPRPRAAPTPEKTDISSGVKYTVRELPAFDARYQVDPQTHVLGGFATLGIGRYIA